MPLSDTFASVTCPACRSRLEESPRDESSFPFASRLFMVGNISKQELGHQYYFTDQGRAALCIASRRRLVTPTPDQFTGQTTAAAHLAGYFAAKAENYLDGPERTTCEITVQDPWTTQVDLPGGHRLIVTVREEEDE